MASGLVQHLVLQGCYKEPVSVHVGCFGWERIVRSSED